MEALTMSQVLTILLTVFAVLASTARLLFRYRSEHHLALEDWLVLFATICLVAETGLVYAFSRMVYFIDGATLNLPVLAFIGKDAALTKELLTAGPSTLVAYFTLGWITIFSIKYSFLALFYKMLRNVSRNLLAYFWCTVAATGMACVVVILESFILCPHFGADAGECDRRGERSEANGGAAQCFLKNNYTFSISTGVVVQALDIVTDLMSAYCGIDYPASASLLTFAVISIPIILLKMSHLRLQHKVRIAVVLCLSSICIILSIVRLAGGIHRNVFGNLQFSTAWISFVLHCEAAVAVLAGSAPALRAIYTSHQNRRTMTMTDDEKPKSLMSRAMTVLGSVRRTKPTLPTQERPRASIARWRESIIAIMPRRTRSRSNRPLANNPEGRNGSEDSGIIHPGIAYHDFQKQEKNRIRVTYECKVLSESASSYAHKSLDLSEVYNSFCATRRVLTVTGDVAYWNDIIGP